MDAPQSQPIEIGLGEREAEGIYANLVFITHSQAEVVLDFARIIMTPQHAKGLLGALEQNLKNYEANFGAIRLPGETGKGKELGFTS